MRNISHIVPPSVVLIHQGGRPPGRDFADELAKDDERGTGASLRHQVAEDHAPHKVPSVTSRNAVSVVVPEASEFVPTTSESAMSTGLNTESAQQLGIVIHPTGITETLAGSRVFGIHLLAGTYLSQLYASADQATSSASLNAVPSGSEGMTEKIHAVSSGVSRVLAVTGADAPSWAEAVEAFDFPATKVVDATTDESRSPAVAKVAPEASQEVLWPEDSLRLTKQLDGSLTLWLRDYRMDDTQAFHVVDALVKEAGSRGVHLGRILWNGREVWTSPNEY